METHEEKTPVKDVFLRAVAVLGLIAVLLLGAWGIIQLAVALPSLFDTIAGDIGSLFSGGAQTETLTVSAPATLASGASLTVSWDHQNGSGDYSYTISYACQTGISVSAPLPTGAYQAVPCNTPFDFVNATAHMTLIPKLTGTAAEPLTLSVAATKLSTGAITASGSAQTTVTPAGSTAAAAPAAAPATSYKGSTGSIYYAAPTRATLYGYPDLAVQILSATPNGPTTQVQFVIQNDGTNVAPAGWGFNANLPIGGGYLFSSQPQQALYPGDKIVYTLNFNNTAGSGTQYTYGYNGQNPYTYTGQNYSTCNLYGPCAIQGYNNGSYNQYYNNGYGYTGNAYTTGTITITADPYNQLVEVTKANNSASTQTVIY